MKDKIEKMICKHCGKRITLASKESFGRNMVEDYYYHLKCEYNITEEE